MTTRVLPPAEWPRLAGTELETVWPQLPRDAAVVLVVEDGDAIIACWALITVRHVEGVWIAPEHRGRASVARRLLSGMRELTGGGAVFTAALTPEVEALLEGLRAEKLPGEHYVLTLGGS